MYLPSLTFLRLIPLPTGLVFAGATPGTEIDIGLSKPMYNTFIASAEIVADGWNEVHSTTGAEIKTVSPVAGSIDSILASIL